jgi:CHAD domain-containing protein
LLAHAGGRSGDISDAGKARISKKISIGAVDWAVVDASGIPEQTLKRCKALIAEAFRADSGTAMSPSGKSGSKAASRAEPAAQRQRHHPRPRLNPAMASDTAFRVVAQRCLEDLTANHAATCGGDPGALHHMRMALTRLRTAVLFFSPMVADPESVRLKSELKWLNADLGAVRDLDVALDRLKGASKRRLQARPDYRSLNVKRIEGHRHLARALQSARYRRLVQSLSSWVESGSWSTTKGKRATRQRARPIARYSVRKLTRWQRKLQDRSRKLRKMNTGKRHQLRLLNKKLCYSIEFLQDLSADKGFSRQHATLKCLRKAQKSLGQLNDDANGQALANTLQRDGIEMPSPFLGRKRKKQLVRTAAKAYRKLTKFKPLHA